MPQDDALIAELTAPTYTFSSTGKMFVESKTDMKKGGVRSPDLADALPDGGRSAFTIEPGGVHWQSLDDGERKGAGPGVD